MKKEDYNLRLLRFATYLSKITITRENDYTMHHLEWKGSYETMSCSIDYNITFFRQLHILFPEHWTNEGRHSEFYGPILIGSRKYGMMYHVGKFFKLNCAEARHLFDLSGKHQDIKKYGGKTLNYWSTSQDLAFNIYQYLDRMAK